MTTIRPIVASYYLEITDHWEADRCAIGLSKHDRVIYISTWRHHDKTEMKYYYDLEILDPVDIANLHVVKSVENATEKRIDSRNDQLFPFFLFPIVNDFDFTWNVSYVRTELRRKEQIH